MEQQTGVLIVAGGVGHRMGSSLPKQFVLLGGQPILVRTINRFAEALPGAEIVVVLPEKYLEFWKNFAARFDVAAHTTICGGEERFHSVQQGIAAFRTHPELIAVQDGVRPLVSEEMIRRTVEAAAIHGAVIPVIEVVDSLREIDGEVSHPVDRRKLRAVQTPQVFRSDWLEAAYRQDYRAEFTDDASVVELAGYAITPTEGERSNLKITTSDDLTLAEALLAARETAAQEAYGEQL